MPQVFDSNCWSCGRFRHEKCRFFNKGDVFDQSGFHSSALLLHCLLSHFLALFLFSQVLDSISFLPSTKRGRHLGSAGNLVWLLFCFVDWSHPRLQRKHHWSFAKAGGVWLERESLLRIWNFSTCQSVCCWSFVIIVRFVVFLINPSQVIAVAAVFFAFTIVIQMWPMVSTSLYEYIKNAVRDPDDKLDLQPFEIPNYVIFTGVLVGGVLVSVFAVGGSTFGGSTLRTN